MRKTLKYIAYAVGGLSTVFMFYAFFLSSLFNTSYQETWKAMDNSPFPCPGGTTTTYKGWGKQGRMRYCEPVKNGPWEAWESGYRNVQGTYQNGKKHGIWTWYHKDGSIYRIKEYGNGVELTNRIVEEN